MDRLLSMELFVAVVEKGSFTAAADAHRLSQPMVGKHIAALEQRLGGKLLVRTTRRQQLTELGQHYYQRCRAILAELAAAEDAAALLRAQPRGVLRVNASITFGTLRLAPLLAEFMARWPDIGVELELSDQLADLVADGYDAVFRIGRLADSGMVARRLRPYRMMIAASPAYLAARGTPATPADLADHDCLGFSRWRRDDGWEALAQLHGVRMRASRFQCNQGQALRQLALSGAGIALQAEALLAEDVAAGRLVSLLDGYLPDPKPMHLIYPADRQPLPKLRVFVDFIVERLGEL
ncbi:DNA-binding transcriptional regulator, LysR family [Chromobacterium violaceum]|uniref:Probable transcriptional regulator LysR family n=2 Tax=Chromobacterium violaceum TaxID=536 RepID=Q7NZ06_CHRVO|nr:LysR family transcriptional regulator [Chromobacterium violaceum]AAQ58791.1 probable transcriptional regulator LysR family [Chromobacterium violaceum ATCC 12472]ATP27850.1 LysR family transcriptional regulator [Chromobacterium violaceum]ATP31762.1 LysR family transcriptional regulator [Chromobacterium violaceum]KMN48855.1 LysR family transcriptional regulator [Chromobacterium violaceum]KMN85516.1 LysR family transcriptional regulator [Chromobacterium violaceum]